MATESSSMGDKPVIVRVKRKAFQSSLDAFWLEINERPFKRPLLDFEKLSISDSSTSRVVEEINPRKILVRHVETVSSSEEAFDVLCNFMPISSDAMKAKIKDKEGRHSIKTVNKQDQLLVKAKQKQEVLSRTARFEQIWRSRKAHNEAPEAEAIHKMCRLYDIVRVDVEEHKAELQKDQDLNDCKMMAQYLPLLRDVLPTAAEEIENDIRHTVSKKASSDGYVYDLYAVDDVDELESQVVKLPLVQVEDDDFYDGPDDSDYETDDSNAENNPLNEYPDEETSEEDVSSKSSDEESDNESEISGDSSEELEAGSHQSLDSFEDDPFEELYGDGEYDYYDGDGGGDDEEEEWR